MALKKDLIIKIQDKEIVVPVNFELIDKVERVYQCTAEIAAAVHLQNMQTIQRRHVAQVISLFVQGKSKDIGPSQVTEEVMTCSQDTLYKYAGMIQASILYSIRGENGQPLISAEQFDALVNGVDIEVDDEKPKSEAAKPAKKPRKAKA